MSNTISRTITLGAAALALTGAAYAGTAIGHADSDTFLDAINANGAHENVPGIMLNLGYHTCALLNSGYSRNAVVNDVYYRTDAGTSWSSANTFVTLAVENLC